MCVLALFSAKSTRSLIYAIKAQLKMITVGFDLQSAQKLLKILFHFFLSSSKFITWHKLLTLDENNENSEHFKVLSNQLNVLEKFETNRV